MSRLILIKHARPEVVEEIPTTEWRLSQEGRQQSRLLAERLRGLGVEALFTSPERKARETAEIIGDVLNLDLQQREGLEEHDRGSVPIMRTGEFIAAVAQFFKSPRRLVLGDETAEEALGRFERALHAVQAEHRGRTIAIVTHGTVLALYAEAHGGGDGFQLWRKMGLPSFAVMQDGVVTEVVEKI